MNDSPLVSAISFRLREAGYEAVSTPISVAGVEFAFTGALRGRGGRGLDLILLFDTTAGDFGDRDATRIRQRVEALGRALDVTGSRYVLTAVLAGASPTTGVEGLAETCRVLRVEGFGLDQHGRPVDDASRRLLDDSILLLLPLTLPADTLRDQLGGETALGQLMAALPATVDKVLAKTLISASEQGEEAVTTAAGDALSAKLEKGEWGSQA